MPREVLSTIKSIRQEAINIASDKDAPIPEQTLIDKGFKRKSTLSDQTNIFNHQVEKQKQMARLHEQLSDMDHPDEKKEINPNYIPVRYENSRYIATIDNKPLAITKEDLLTDGQWGLHYELDSSVPRNIRKKYIVGETKRSLKELYDRQIVIDMASSELTDKKRRNAYIDIANNWEHRNRQAGIIAEKIFVGFLTKAYMAIDLPIEISQLTIEGDMDVKADVIISLVNTGDANSVEVKTSRNKGIQLTTCQDEETINHKRQQIEEALKLDEAKRLHLKNILLLTTGEDFVGLLHEWEKHKLPGGPDKLLSKAAKELFFTKGLAGLLPEDKIPLEWERAMRKSAVRPYSNKK